MSLDFQQAVRRVSDVVMFENWLRFYFIEEGENEELLIRIPEKSMEMIQNTYPEVFGLAEKLNNKVIDHQRSIEAICLFVATAFEGEKIDDILLASVLDSREFMLGMQLFSTWVQSHESQLDENFLDFTSWKTMFADWKQQDKVQKYMHETEGRLNRTEEGSETIH